ncbi:HYC_CC_PP family protein [Nonlabens ponticola]|uniref:DUF2946 domain-containing protein n=1 Tax=Nonlabens ponticola TaxID=2496866 RepID=A0A3S9N0U3_9FLAO|nr:hypothetical protein [Nonlabens ponticola]AZQ44952.1 hypothetical protein EJ995_12220 [Nonlabens ponticola]
MHSWTHRILAIAMSLLLLGTTTSFSIDAHVCGGEIVDISLTNDSDCNMQMMDHEMHDLMKKMGCCQDHNLASIGQDDVQPSMSDFSLDQQQFIIAFTHSYVVQYVLPATAATSYSSNPEPPLPRQPLYILHESYLI